MAFPPRPAPVQGLQAAQPSAAPPPDAGQDPQAAVAMSVLQDAVAQYGPGILLALKQILMQAGPGGGVAPMPMQGMM